MRKNFSHVLQKNYNNILSFLLLIFFSVIGMLYYWDRSYSISEKEAQEAIWRAVQDFEKERYQLALEGDGVSSGFFYVIKKYPKTQAANIAKYYVALIYIDLEKFNESIKLLKKVQFPSKSIFASMRLGLLATAHYNLNQKKEAITYYKKAIDLHPNAYLTPTYLLRFAKLLEEEGDLVSAQSCYRKIIDLKPVMEIGQEAEMQEERLSVLLRNKD